MKFAVAVGALWVALSALVIAEVAAHSELREAVGLHRPHN